MKRIRISEGLDDEDRNMLYGLAVFVIVLQVVMVLLKCMGIIRIPWVWVFFLLWGIPLGFLITVATVFLAVLVFMMIDHYRWYRK